MSFPEGKIPTVAIITSVTDGYDTLKKTLPQFGVNAEWIAVTDGKETVEPDHGWKVVPFLTDGDYDPRKGHFTTENDRSHPNRMAKLPKCRPWDLTDAPYSIWIDASYRVTSPLFAFQALQFANPIAQFIHPWRDCALEEAEFSRTLTKYSDQERLIHLQRLEYEQIGHPAHWGLWATGVIVRKHTSDVRFMGEQWLAEIRRHSYQDQVSEPVVLRLCDLRPNPLPGDHITNSWLKYEGSAKHG